MTMLPVAMFRYQCPRPRRQHRYRNWPGRMLDQDFGYMLTHNDLQTEIFTPMFTPDNRPWIHSTAAAPDVGPSIRMDKDQFQINLNVRHFTPEEISVKTTDRYVVVEGKHEEKEDEHGYISRQFVRRYALPEGVVPERVESRLSSEGVLSISAPMMVPDAVRGERQVPITHTGPFRNIKDDINQTNETQEKK